MAHELIRLTEKLFNTPHLITPSSFNNMVSYLTDRNIGDIDLSITKKSRTPNSSDVFYNPDTKIGIIDVSGPLTYVEMTSLCEGESASYQKIESQFDAMVKAGAETIVLDIDSPGGEAYGVFETGRYLREVSDKNGIKLLAYVDGLAASAGFALAACAHEIISNPSSEIGSVGVLIRLRNTNKAMKAVGIEDQYIFAGDNKIPFDKNGEFRKEFIDDLQSKVDFLYKDFVQYISEMRNIEQSKIKSTEASVFLAEKALAIGFVDDIKTRNEFFNYLADISEQGNQSMLKTKLFSQSKLSADEMEIKNDMKLEEIQAALETAKTELASSQELLATAQSQLTAATASNEALLSQVATMSTELSDLKAWKESKLQDEVKAKQLARKEQIAKLVQEDQRESLFASTENLDDAAFNAIVSVLGMKTKNELENPLFKEAGVSDEGAGVTDEDGTTRLIKQKYSKK